MRPAGEPRLDLGSFVGGIVIRDDMDIEPFWDSSIDLFEEVQELGRPVTLVAFADDKPRGDIECGASGKGLRTCGASHYEAVACTAPRAISAPNCGLFSPRSAEIISGSE
jgi:hypothetical protein